MAEQLRRFAVRVKCSSAPVTLARDGVVELEVPTTLSQGAAERRAVMLAVAKRWGDLDTVEVLGSRELAQSEWSE